MWPGRARAARRGGRWRCSGPQLPADLVRPARGVEPVGREQRERDALEAEAQARGVDLGAALAAQAEGRGEVIAVVVEGGHGGRLGPGDRDEDLPLELLL